MRELLFDFYKSNTQFYIYGCKIGCYFYKLLIFNVYCGAYGTYISAVNHLKCKPGDNPTIGLLICKTKNQVMAQYALESTNQPIGISEYELSKLIPEDIKSQLPSIEEIEEQVKRIQGKKEEER